VPVESGVLFEDWAASQPAPTPSHPAAEKVRDAQPRFQFIDRSQSFFCTVDVNTLIEDDHPARAIWKVVEKLDLTAFSQQARAVKGSAGRSAVDPRLLVSLWVFAYSQAVGSAREISRLCDYHPAYRWLTGAQGISGHTLSSFRVEHKTALERVFVDVVGVLSAEGFIQLKRVMLDGTKVRALAAADSLRSQERLEAHLQEAREQYAKLSEAEESKTASLVQMRAQERAAKEKVERLEGAVVQAQKLAASGKEEARVSSSDPESRKMKHQDGAYAPSYNVQTATTAVGKAIVSVDVTQEGNDFKQLTPAIDRLQRTLDKPEQTVVDGGYISQENLVETATNGVEVIGPVSEKETKAAQCYERRGVKEEYYAERFRFDATENCMYCPEGVKLRSQGKTKSELVVISKYQARPQDCAACAAKADCCPKNQKSGRSVQRSEYHEEIRGFQEKMALPENKEIYRQRSEVAETPHLWMKAKFGLWQFHVRGLVKVAQEALWAALTYNILLLLRCRKRAIRA